MNKEIKIELLNDINIIEDSLLSPKRIIRKWTKEEVKTNFKTFILITL